MYGAAPDAYEPALHLGPLARWVREAWQPFAGNCVCFGVHHHPEIKSGYHETKHNRDLGGKNGS
jgi:hypothetical protein